MVFAGVLKEIAADSLHAVFPFFNILITSNGCCVASSGVHKIRFIQTPYQTALSRALNLRFSQSALFFLFSHQIPYWKDTPSRCFVSSICAHAKLAQSNDGETCAQKIFLLLFLGIAKPFNRPFGIAGMRQTATRYPPSTEQEFPACMSRSCVRAGSFSTTAVLARNSCYGWKTS